jgi:hypothetical protein
MLEKLFKFIEPDFESVLDINQFPLPGRRLSLAAYLFRLPQEPPLEREAGWGGFGPGWKKLSRRRKMN